MSDIKYGSLIWLVINVVLLVLIVIGIIRRFRNMSKTRKQVEKNPQDIKELQYHINKKD